MNSGPVGFGVVVAVPPESGHGAPAFTHSVIAAMSADAFLLVLVRPTADLGALLFDLRRHRANIAALV